MARCLYNVSVSLTVFTVLGCMTARPAAAASLIPYTVQDLGTLGGTFNGAFGIDKFGSEAFGINNLGQIVGSSFIKGDTDIHAFRTAPNSPINLATDDLGTLGGTFSSAAGINDLGQVVGSSSNIFGGQQAFRTAPNSPINPDTDNLGGFEAETFGGGINNLGQVVATESLATTRTTFAYRTAPDRSVNREIDDLGFLGGSIFSIFSSTSSINDLGQAVGSSTTSSGETHAFRTAPNSPINPATDDLSTLGGMLSEAFDINNLGQVVGYSETSSGQTHAFRTAPNSPINVATDDLGTLGGTLSEAFGINNLGQVVGSSLITGDTAERAFLFSDGTINDLNSLIAPNSLDGFSFLQRANAINDQGQIVGRGILSNGTTHAFLATPVPEPSSVLGVVTFGALGAGSLLQRKLKKHKFT